MVHTNPLFEVVTLKILINAQNLTTLYRFLVQSVNDRHAKPINKFIRIYPCQSTMMEQYI